MKNPLLFPAALFAVSVAFGAESTASPGAFDLPQGLEAAHQHLLTNHLPILVTFSGLIALGLAILWKNDTAKRIALILLMIGAVGGLITYWLGQQAYKPVRRLADETGQDWLDLHMERAEQVVWLFWTAAAASLAALAAVWRKLRFAKPLTFVAAAAGAAMLGASGWIADAGGKIRHPEIRGDAVPLSGDAAGTKLDDSETGEAPPHEH